jgi:hypothetical protein
MEYREYLRIRSSTWRQLRKQRVWSYDLHPVKENEIIKRIALGVHILALAVVICSGLLVATGIGEAQQGANAPSAEATESLKKFLRTFYGDRTPRYMLALRDLNGDRIPEAIVYLSGSEWCGSGGCNTLILTPNGSSWTIVTNISITRPPIYVLSGVSKGWHSIGVWVQGGGIQPGYEAELRFNGKTYPKNPSVSPARRLEGKPVGEVVIPSAQDAQLLYDDQTDKSTGP